MGTRIATLKGVLSAATRIRFLAALRSYAIAAIFLAGFAGWSHAQAPKGPVVMVYGDSLSAAYGIKPEEGWVALMSQQFAKDAATKTVRVVNASISGETTHGGRARIKTDLAQHKPSIVVLALGANDGLRGLPTKETRANIAFMLDAIRDAKAQAIIVGIQIPPNFGIDYTREFRDLFPAIAKERKLPLVPFLLDGIADNLDWFQPDRLHPTAAAQPRILQNVLPAVRTAMRAATTRAAQK